MENKILLQELAERLAVRGNVSRRDAELFVRCVLDVIEESLQTDKIVKIKGLGTFKLVSVESRESVDVNTGERIRIKGYVKVAFTPDPALRDQVNKPFSQFETVILNDGISVEDMERVDLAQDHLEDAESSGEESEEDTQDFEDDSVQPEPEHADLEPEPVEDGSVPVPAPDADGTSAVDQAVLEDGPSDEPEPSTGSDEPDEASVDGTEQAHEASPEEVGERQEVHATVVEHQHAEYQKITEQQVSELNVSSQRIEHQTVEHQSIVHTSERKPDRKDYRMSLWAVIALVLVIVLLMAGSYLVGYYRLLCPCGFMDLLEKNVPPVEQLKEYSEQVNRPVPADSADSCRVVLPDSLRAGQAPVDTPAVVRDSLGTVPAVRPANKPDTVRMQATGQPKAVRKAVSEPREQRSGAGINARTTRVEQNRAKEYAQISGGKYLIVGTRLQHTLKAGESLRRISLKYYGSKDFVNYIVLHNKIKDPDLIPVGMTLAIPELRLK